MVIKNIEITYMCEECLTSYDLKIQAEECEKKCINDT